MKLSLARIGLVAYGLAWALVIACGVSCLAVVMAVPACVGQPSDPGDRPPPGKVTYIDANGVRSFLSPDELEKKLHNVGVMGPPLPEGYNPDAPPTPQPGNPRTSLGKESAKASLVEAATWVGRLSALIGLAGVGLLVASFIFSGIGRKTAVGVIAIAGVGIWLRFFILDKGYVVSEAISWAAIVCLAVVGLLGMFMGARYLYDLWDARGLSLKRSASGEDGDDVIAKLPVSNTIRSELHDAWEVARGAITDPAMVNRFGGISGAVARIRGFGLKAPTPPAS